MADSANMQEHLQPFHPFLEQGLVSRHGAQLARNRLPERRSFLLILPVTLPAPAAGRLGLRALSRIVPIGAARMASSIVRRLPFPLHREGRGSSGGRWEARRTAVAPTPFRLGREGNAAAREAPLPSSLLRYYW